MRSAVVPCLMPEQAVGKVTHYFGNAQVAVIELTKTIKVGDRLHVKGATDDFTFEVSSMQIEHEQVQEAKKGQSIGVKVPEKAHEGSDVLRVTPD